MTPSASATTKTISVAVRVCASTSQVCAAAAERAWTETCVEIADHTLFAQGESWIFGANIPGKANAVMFYMAGLGSYRQRLTEVVEADYHGFIQQAARMSEDRLSVAST